MSWILDILMVLVVAGCAYYGGRRGFVKTLCGTVLFIIAAILAGILYNPVANTLFGGIGNRDVAKVISFFVVFSVALVGVVVACYFLDKFMKVASITVLDRILGMAFGIIGAAVVVSVVLMVLSAYGGSGVNDGLKHSRLAPIFLHFGRIFTVVLPGELTTRVTKFLKSR